MKHIHFINRVLYPFRPIGRAKGSPYKKIAIYKPDRIGDCILALGAIRKIVITYGVDNCVLVGSRFAIDVLLMEWPTLEVVQVDFGHNHLWRTLRELRRLRGHPIITHGVETLLCLRHQRFLRDVVLLAAIPCGVSIGQENSLHHLGMTSDIPHVDYCFSETLVEVPAGINECRELAAHRNVVSAALGKPIPPEDVTPNFTSVQFENPRTVSISPFGSLGIRDIPKELLAVMCAEAIRGGYRCQMLAEPKKKAAYEKLTTDLSQLGVCGIGIVITTSVGALVREVAKSSVIIAAETSTAHIAAAMDKRLIAVVGGGHYGWFSPWRRSSGQRWLTEKTDCFGCGWHCPYETPKCIAEISSERARAEFVKIIELADRNI